MISRVKHIFQNAFKTWEDFFFAPVPTSNFIWMRRGLALILFLFYAIRMLDFQWIFGDKGLLPYQTLLTAIPDYYRPPFFFAPLDETQALIANVALLLFLLAQAIGLGEKFLGGRAVAAMTFLLNAMLVQRNFVVLYGADYTASAWLLYMMMVRTDGRHDRLSSASYRLLQIQVCVVYAYGGLEKLRGESWWDGSAIWRVMSNPVYVSQDFSYIAHVPGLVAICTFTTALWETYFPFVVWSKRHRLWYLAVGVAIHAGIALTMHLVFFSWIMVVSYFIFLPRIPSPPEFLSSRRSFLHV